MIDAQQPHADAEFTIDGSEIQQITFIGQIRSLAQQATNTTYKLDDGTGLIEVKQWLDPEAPPKMDGLEEGKYCRVFGRMKSFNSKRHVGSHFIRPITDMNEVTMHLLEATYVHLYFTRGPPEQQQGGAGMTVGAGGAVKQEEGLFVDQGHQVQRNTGPQIPSGMSATARKVFSYLQTSPDANEGVHVNQIAAALSLPSNEIFKAGDELLGMGIVYTTVDDETWAVLEYN